MKMAFINGYLSVANDIRVGRDEKNKHLPLWYKKV